MRLAAKFTLLLVVGIVILLAVDGYLGLQRDIEIFDQDMAHDAIQLSEKLRPLVAEHWQQGGHEQVGRFIEQINAGKGLIDLPDESRQFVRVHWVILDAKRHEKYCPLATDEELKQVAAGRVFSVKHEDQGKLQMITYARVDIDSPRPVALEVAEPAMHSAERKHAFGNRMMILSAMTLLLGIAMVVLVGRELVGRPLQLLVDKTRRIGQGDFSDPVQLQRRDEFGELATAINSMCDQLVDAQDAINAETAARIAALEQLRHDDRLRTVGRLASGVAHEIGTPLNVVGGRAAMIASGSLSPDETKKSAEVIQSESDRITTIIRQLLDFARRSTPNRTRGDMRQIVNQTIDLLEPLAEKRRVTIKSVAKNESYPCNVDTGQFQQVLTNLLVNAIHAMPDGGTVELDIRRAHVKPPETEQAAAGEYLLISVRDNGQGIAAEDLEQIFEPFFTTKDVGEGTGLGLSIAYRIAEEHGGWIDVESEVHNGSCFTVYMPLEVAS